MTEIETDGGIVVVRFAGSRLDAVRAPDVKTALRTGLAERPTRVLIDVGNLDFIDSTGLGTLVFLLKLMGEGGRVAVLGAKPNVRRLFEITRLDTVFRLTADREAAALVLAG